MKTINNVTPLSKLVTAFVMVLVFSTATQAVTNIACTGIINADGINTAIQTEGPGGRVNLTGTCRENIVINVRNFTLSKGGTRPVIIPANVGTASGVTVSGARNVSLIGLNVRKATTNISIDEASTVEIIGVSSSNSFSGAGLEVDEGSSVSILNSTFRDNQGAGIHVFRNSLVSMANGTVTGNNLADPNDGAIVVSSASHLSASNSAIINNNGEGITVANHSSARLTGNNITNNGTLPAFNPNTGGNTFFQYFNAGVGVYNHSFVRFAGGNAVTDNAYYAIAAYSNSNIRQGLFQPERNSNTGARIGPMPQQDTFTMRALGVDPIFGGNEDQGDAVAVEAGRLSVIDLRNAVVTGGMNAFGGSEVRQRFGSVNADPNRPIFIDCSARMIIDSAVSFDDVMPPGNNNGDFDSLTECNVTIP